ncbi:MAG TPA: TSUP family transporter, partial [Thermomicrobiales bacterium]|nr:TSUP family transporter [Thermomicrobiales bacterium]
PIVALFAGRAYAPRPFRASAAAFFLPVDLFGLAALYAQGGIHRAEWTLALALAPPALLGTALGRQAARRISVALFRQVVLGLLLLTGVVGGVASLAALLR